jgi:carbon storage regulator CsrA
MKIQNGQIRFGIDAPEEVKVYREEIYERIQAEAKRDKSVA